MAVAAPAEARELSRLRQGVDDTDDPDRWKVDQTVSARFSDSKRGNFLVLRVLHWRKLLLFEHIDCKKAEMTKVDGKKLSLNPTKRQIPLSSW